MGLGVDRGRCLWIDHVEDSSQARISELAVHRGAQLYNFSVADFGKLLVFLGGAIVVVGLGLMLLGRTNLPLGRLPGDIVYRGKNTTFYFPLVTSILLSVLLSAVMYLIGRFRR